MATLPTPFSNTDARRRPAAALIERFSSTERAVHWAYALFFLILMATGLVMQLAFLSVLVPDRYIVRLLHFASAFLLVVVPPLIALFGDRRAVAATAQEMDVWDEDDRRWFSDLLNGFGTQPGRFNAGQKLNAIFTLGALLLFTISGLFMLMNIYSRLLPLWLVSNASFVHDTLTWLALAAWLGHVFLAIVYPPTRPAMRGMLLGSVRSDWARDHHPKWYEHVLHPGGRGRAPD